MTAEPSESPVTEGVRSLEVRWIFPGQLETAVAEWLERFPAESQSREDTYLVDPQLRGLSVKVRGGGALEVKAYRGSPGELGSGLMGDVGHGLSFRRSRVVGSGRAWRGGQPERSAVRNDTPVDAPRAQLLRGCLVKGDRSRRAAAAVP
jgi:hypothetical protein